MSVTSKLINRAIGRKFFQNCLKRDSHEFISGISIMKGGSVGERNIATHESDEFGSKLGAVVFVRTKKVCHLVEQ